MSVQTFHFVTGVVQFALSFFLAIVCTYGSFKFFDLLTRDIDESAELNKNNVAVGLLLAGILLSSALIVHSVTSPAVSTFYTYFNEDVTLLSWIKIIAYFVGYVAVAFVVAMGSIWIAIAVFVRMTRRIDEFAEIKKGNVAVAILLGTAIVIMGFFMKYGIRALLEGFAPMVDMVEVDEY